MLSAEQLEAVVADALALCAVPAPTFDEGERAGELRRRFEALGLEASLDRVGNVLCPIGAADGPPLVVAAHLDTVFGRDVEVVPRRDGDRLAGPGIGDDALALAALLHLARACLDGAPSRRLVLAATVGEEGEGDLKGVTALVQDLRPAALIAVEGHGRDELALGAIGSIRLEVVWTGPGGHSWRDRGRPSAIHALAGGCAAALAAADGRHLNIGVAEGGTTINSIAARASVRLDLRDEQPAALEGTVARILAALRQPIDGIDVAIREIGRRPAGGLPPEHALAVAARRAREAEGLPPAQEIASSTDANAAHGAGIPALTVGLTRGAGEHTLDEWIEVEPIRTGVAVLERLVRAQLA